MADGFRDWAALHAPLPPMGWRDEGRPVAPAAYSHEAQLAYDAEVSEFEAKRDVEWRWHFADLMVAARNKEPTA